MHFVHVNQILVLYSAYNKQKKFKVVFCFYEIKNDRISEIGRL